MNSYWQQYAFNLCLFSVLCYPQRRIMRNTLNMTLAVSFGQVTDRYHSILIIKIQNFIIIYVIQHTFIEFLLFNKIRCSGMKPVSCQITNHFDVFRRCETSKSSCWEKKKNVQKTSWHNIYVTICKIKVITVKCTNILFWLELWVFFRLVFTKSMISWRTML